jgi:branched-chain amino acid transport system ATP-binding protein
VTGAPSPAVLEVRGLRAGYDGVEVVRGLDLRVGAGEVVALLGPNGAGKTTTLLTVSGLLARLGGDVRVFGEPVPARTRARSAARALELVRRGLSHVPEDRGLFAGLTGREHLRLAVGRRDPAAIDDALAPFPVLAGVLDRRAGLLSGGEQQMLAIARALVARPRLLMIDELSLGLAPIVVEQLLPTLRDTARARGIGMLLVEQHVGAALAVADRAYVLVRGVVTASGPAAELAADRARLAQGYLGGAP